MAVDPSNPHVVVTAANDYGDSAVAAYWSGDAGKTFTRRTAMPQAAGAQYEADPNLAFDTHGHLYFAYLTYGDSGNVGGLAVVRSDNGGRTWPAKPTLITHDFLQRSKCAAADFPAITVDQKRDIVYVAWQHLDRVSSGTCGAGSNHPVSVVSSRDGGQTWSQSTTVPRLTGEVPFLPTLAVAPDGSLYVTYDSISLTAKGNRGCSSSGARLHVLVARSTDAGGHFTATVVQNRCVDGTLINTSLLNASSWTGATWRLPSNSNTVVDPVTKALVSVVGYQDALSGQQRLSIVRSTDAGRHWHAGGAIADLPGVQQQMPRLAVGADGRISLVWIAQLAGGHIWPSHAWSLDDGRTWSSIQRLTTPAQRGGPDAQFFLGDYIGDAVGSDGRAHPTWTDPRELDLDESGGTIYTRAVAP